MQVGSLAPDFDLVCVTDPGGSIERVQLGGFRGRWLALVFYPRDLSLVCPTEVTNLGAHLSDFQARGCELLGVSCDDVETHRRWLATPRARGGVAGLGYPLASDPEGIAARAYNVYVEFQHVALRGLFLIDPNGVLQYSVVHNMSVGRGPEEILRVLSALQTGGLCPSEWTVGERTLDPTRALRSGSQISHYRIDDELGSGTFATVYRATDLTLQRSVALKVLKPDAPAPASAVLAEARSTAALNHPNICTVFAVDDSEGVPIIAMEYAQGEPLSRMLAAGPIAVDRVRRIARQLASGVAAAHDSGIVHGDLKPENVIVGDGDAVKILDFGLARRDRRAELDPYAETAVLGVAEIAGIYGTPGYMAPEMVRGVPASNASDVFAFGVVLYELLTGRKAFPGENVPQILERIRHVDPNSLAAEVPRPLDALLRRCLVREPEERTISMAEIAEQVA